MVLMAVAPRRLRWTRTPAVCALLHLVIDGLSGLTDDWGAVGRVGPQAADDDITAISGS